MNGLIPGSRVRRVTCPALLAILLSAIPVTLPAQTATKATKPSGAAEKTGATPDLTGVYGLTADSSALPPGLKNTGSPEDIALLPAAMEVAKQANLSHDPAKNCQAVGPFRMMALPGNKIDVLPSPGKVTILFENLALGNKRAIFLTRPHPDKLNPSWLGDTIGHWDGDTLVVDSVGYNDRTWLNSKGAQHSDDLHIVERYRLVDGGKFLEVKVTAEDPKTLAKPYTYTRYYERLNTEIQEDYCQEETPVE